MQLKLEEMFETHSVGCLHVFPNVVLGIKTSLICVSTWSSNHKQYIFWLKSFKNTNTYLQI